MTASLANGTVLSFEASLLYNIIIIIIYIVQLSFVVEQYVLY